MKKTLLLLFVLFLNSLFAESFVWVVQKGNSKLYLGGTIHLLRPHDFPLPKAFTQAYTDSDIVTFETQMDLLKNMAAQQSLTSKMAYTDGSTIQQHLSSGTYAALEDYAKKNNLPLETMQQMKASMIVMMIEQIELMKLGATEDGVDMFFYQQTLSDQKQTDYFETLEEQLNIILSIGEDDEDAFVLYTLESLQDIDTTFYTMINYWKNGNSKQLSSFLLDQLADSPKLYNKLLIQRNKAWLPKIEHYMQTQQTEFVLVGAGHLLGPKGLLEMLRKKGYKVTQL